MDIFYKNKILAKVKVAKTAFALMKGLMFSAPLQDGEGLLLIREKEGIFQSSIHMLFVFYSIDMLWLDKRKRIVDKRENVKPFTLFVKPRKKAMYILELPQGASKVVNIGDVLEFSMRLAHDNKCTTIEEFNKIKNQIISSFIPSSGDNLLGMEMDFDYYLEDSELFENVEIKQNFNKEELLVVLCKSKNKLNKQLCDDITKIWNDYLKYNYKDAYIIIFDNNKIEFSFITQMSNAGLFVTGKIIVTD